MYEIERFADELGPTKIVHLYEPKSGLKATLVIDNVAAGPAIGGIRMAPDVTTEECFRLARAMTLKNIAAGLPHGGGKVVVCADPKMELQQKEIHCRALACALRDLHEYILAPDMGTDEQCMAWIKDELDRVVGLPVELGGIPLDEIGATGWGVCHAVDVASNYAGFSLEGARVIVQGFGAVGTHAAKFLEERGAVIVGVADSKGAVCHDTGFVVDELLATKSQGRSVVECPGGRAISTEELIALECDVWIPAARPDVLHRDNVHLLNTKIVVQGANIPCTKEAEHYLHEHKILCVPDFIANAGGVICAALEYQGASLATVMQRIEEIVRRNTYLILKDAVQQSLPPRTAADNLARNKLARVMATKRWTIF